MSDKLQQGLTAARVGDMAEARRLLTEATEEMPDNVRAWLELAGVVESLEEKRACFAQVLTLDPDHVEAKAGLALVEQKLATQPAEETVSGPTTPALEIFQAETSFCYRHPEVETGLRCNRCSKPICPKCAQRTPVGFRCPDCILEIEDRYYSQVKSDYLNPFDQPLSKPLFTFILLGLITLIWAIMELAGGSTENEVLIKFGANYGPLIFEGQVWRLFTSMFLHIGGEHLMFNFIGLVAFGFQTERIYGRGRYIVIYLLAGLFGNLASLIIRGSSMFSAGASGAIFGIIGMNLAFFLLYRRRLGEYGRRWRKTMLILIGVSLVLGFTVMPADNVAHMGGLLAGFVLGYGLAPRYQVDYTNVTRRIFDKASLSKRWWVLALGLVSLAGGVWLAFSFWSGIGRWIPTPFPQTWLNEKKIEYGQTVEGQITIEEGETWTFEGEAGQVVNIGLRSGSVDWYLYLYGPDEQFLINTYGNEKEYTPNINDYILPDSGTYTIFIQSIDEYSIPYKLTLKLVDTLDPDNLGSSGGPIEYGQMIKDYITTEAGDTWTFEGQAGQVVTVVMSSDTLDSYLELYSPDGQFLVNDYDSGKRYNARINEYILSTSGTYTILAQSMNGYSAPYDLTLKLVNTLDPDELDNAGGPIEYDQTLESYLTTSEGETWTFEGKAGEIVTIAMNSDTLDSYLELRSPDGQLLASDDDSGGGYNSRIDQYTLPASGTYIIVAQSTDDRLAAYELTLKVK